VGRGERASDGKTYAEIAAAPEAKAADPDLHRRRQQDAGNKWETVKQFAILPTDLTIDAGRADPVLKVKRKVVEKKYSSLLDKMYEGAMADV
jgi:long-chain acyl-CoA synthetase